MKTPHGIPARYRKKFAKDHWEFMRNHSFDPITKMVTNPAHPNEPHHIGEAIALGITNAIIDDQLKKCIPVRDMPRHEGITDHMVDKAEELGLAYIEDTDELFDPICGIYFSQSLLPTIYAGWQ